MHPFPTPHLPEPVAKDPILGLIQIFKEDPRPEKIDLLAGVLRKKNEVTLFESVQEAQQLFLKQQKHKNYLPIRGDLQAVELVSSLIWKKLPPVQMQTLGGTGALFLASKLAYAMGYRKAIISSPSWPNHARLIQEAQLELETYEHLENKAFEALEQALKAQVSPCLLLLQPLCHNPTGVDFTLDQLKEIFNYCKKQGHLVLFDVAYMGFKASLKEDGAYLEQVTSLCPSWLMSFSCAKNMTLYGERLGFLLGQLDPGLGDDARILQYLAHLARSIYSNPPMHASGISKTILAHEELKEFWIQELQGAYTLLQGQRAMLSATFEKAGFMRWAKSIEKQKGLFGYFPLSSEKANLLKEARAIYLPLEGRVNLTSLDLKICDKLIEGLKELGVGE
jgi:aromatic-amino-acid transaminase